MTLYLLRENLVSQPTKKMTTLSRSKIIAVAQRLFDERGYANTSIEDIAEALGVRKGAIHYHVPRKADLLVEIMRSLLVPVVDALAQIAGAPLDPPTKLANAIEIHLSTLLRNQAAARVFFEERRELPADTRPEVEQLDDSIRQQFERIIAEGVADGSFRSVSPKLAALHILALCNWPYRWYNPAGPLDLSDIVVDVQAQALHGLRRPIATHNEGAMQ